MNRKEIALEFCKLGVPVFPVTPGCKFPPKFEGWQKWATTDAAKAKAHWDLYPDDNLGLFMDRLPNGKYLNIVDLDIGENKNGIQLFQEWCKTHDVDYAALLQSTLVIRTISGGIHIYLTSDVPIHQGTNVLGPGIDTRCNAKGYGVGPTSVVQGKAYTVLHSPDTDDFAPMPSALVEVLKEGRVKESSKVPPTQPPITIDANRAESRAVHYLEHEAPLAIEGLGGDETTYKVAAICKDYGVEREGTIALMARYWNDRCSPPWDESQLATKVNNAYGYGKDPIGVSAPEVQFPPIEVDDDEPTKYSFKKDWSDTGNKNVLVSESRGDLRYVPETDSFIHWTKKHWKEDRAHKKATQAAARVAEYYRAQIDTRRQALQNLADGARKDEEKAIAHLESWERTCRNRNGTGGILNMLAMAKTDERVIVELEKLDVSRHLLGVQNGVVDLRTGLLCEAPREAYITKQSAYPFNPGAVSPLWDRIVGEVTGVPGRSKGEWTPQPEMAGYLHRLLGYLLTGETKEQKFFIWNGSGANGKSLLVDVVLSILGDYGWVASPDLLIQPSFIGDAERATPGIAALVGKRAVFCSEGRPGQKLDMGVVKRHTGEESLTCRRLHGSPFTYPVHHKLTYLTNVVPALDHVDEASVGRLHILPFLRTWNRPGHTEPNARIPDADPDLKKKLLAEAPGILARMVAEARRYYEDGLIPPPQVRAKTQAYIASQDGFSQWVEHSCERRAEGQLGWTAAKLALGHYNRFAIENEFLTMTPNAFAAAVARHRIGQKKTRTGMTYGIKILVQDFEPVTEAVEPKLEPAPEVAERLLSSVNNPFAD
jgi:P4 family phage/plasmid primase-like protien